VSSLCTLAQNQVSFFDEVSFLKSKIGNPIENASIFFFFQNLCVLLKIKALHTIGLNLYKYYDVLLYRVIILQ